MAEDSITVSEQIALMQSSVSELNRVCRNIITLASQYGFAGYVDIAVHNNDANAHKAILDAANARLDALELRVAALEAKTSNL